MKKEQQRNSATAQQNKSLKTLLLYCSAALLLIFSLQPSAFGAEKWPGVDESVIEKYAKEHGREAKEPLINTDQGDLLLFVFLLSGTVGGFVAGYYWKELTTTKKQQQTNGEDTEGDCPRFFASANPPERGTDGAKRSSRIKTFRDRLRIGTVPDTTKHGNI